jgi:2-methylisocitrate lyase-like PEP mutase family enzyme
MRARSVAGYDNDRMFRELHHQTELLILPNAWDTASARVLEAAGFPAIATTSAGIAAVLGYPDGESAPLARMIDAARTIIDAVRVPVSIDLEAGYGDVTSATNAAVSIGAVGINLEDIRGGSLVAIDEQVEAIRAARRCSAELFINARTDEFWRPGSRDLDLAIERLRAYVDAGADGVFVPGLEDEAQIRRLTTAVRAPLNILASERLPDPQTLRAWGVARVSLGSAIFRASLAVVDDIAQQLRRGDVRGAAARATYSYASVQQLMARPATSPRS